MKENDYENIDKIFQNNLKNPPLDEGVWNQPPDSIFDRAMNQIDAKKDKKKRRGIYLFFLGLFLLLGAFIIRNYLQINNNKDTISHFANSDKEETDASNTTLTHDEVKQESYQSAQANNVLSESKESETDKINTQQSTNSAAKGSLLHQPKRDKRFKTSDQYLKTTKPISATIEETRRNPNHTDHINLNKTSNRINSTQQYFKAFTPVDRLYPQPLQIETLNLLAFNESFLIDQNIHSHNKSQHIIYTSFNNHFSSLNMKGVDLEMASLLNYDDSYYGYSQGIGYRNHFHKNWSGNIELGYKSIKNLSIYKESVIYDKANLTATSDQRMIYNAPLAISSPMQTKMRRLTGDMTDVQINDKDEMDHKSKITNSFRSIYVHLIPSYRLNITPKLEASVGAGVSIDYFVSMKEDIHTHMSLHGEQIMENSYSEKMSSTTNSITAGGIGEVMLSYSILPKLSIGVHGRYYRSINSLNRKINSTPGETYIHDIQTGIQINYLIN